MHRGQPTLKQKCHSDAAEIVPGYRQSDEQDGTRTGPHCEACQRGEVRQCSGTTHGLVDAGLKRRSHRSDG